MNPRIPTHPIIQDSEHDEKMVRRRKWVEEAFVHTVRQAREGILYGHSERRAAGILVRVSIPMPGSAGSDEYRIRIEALCRLLIAGGFNSAILDDESEYARLKLWVLYDPVRVVTSNGERFNAEIGLDEAIEDAVQRIVQRGSWRHLENGGSIYVSAHHVAGVEIERAYPDAENGT